MNIKSLSWIELPLSFFASLSFQERSKWRPFATRLIFGGILSVFRGDRITQIKNCFYKWKIHLIPPCCFNPLCCYSLRKPVKFFYFLKLDIHPTFTAKPVPQFFKKQQRVNSTKITAYRIKTHTNKNNIYLYVNYTLKWPFNAKNSRCIKHFFQSHQSHI